MKVKYFDTVDYDLEGVINDFIKDKKIIDIKYQQNLVEEYELITSVLIMYEEE